MIFPVPFFPSFFFFLLNLKRTVQARKPIPSKFFTPKSKLLRGIKKKSPPYFDKIKKRFLISVLKLKSRLKFKFSTPSYQKLKEIKNKTKTIKILTKSRGESELVQSMNPSNKNIIQTKLHKQNLSAKKNNYKQQSNQTYKHLK